ARGNPPPSSTSSPPHDRSHASGGGAGVSDVAAACALVLAVVFGWAGVAKLRHHDATVESFRGLRLPAPAALARIVPVVELAVAAGLVLAPASAALAALVMLLAFTVVIARSSIAASAATSGRRRSLVMGSDEGRRVDRVVRVAVGRRPRTQRHGRRAPASGRCAAHPAASARRALRR